MLRRRVFSFPWVAFIFAVALLTAGGLPQPAHADEFGDGAKKFVEVLADDAIRSLAVNDISEAERASRFRNLMLRNFAVKGIGKFVLGRHWRKASDPIRKEYLRLFEDLLVATYAQRFAKYAGETLNIGRAEVRGQRDVIVHSTMLRVDSAKPLKIAWRVRGTKSGTYKIVDIMVEGISMIQTQKSEFASFIKKNGGKLDPLLKEIRNRIEANP